MNLFWICVLFFALCAFFFCFGAAYGIKYCKKSFGIPRTAIGVDKDGALVYRTSFVTINK